MNYYTFHIGDYISNTHYLDVYEDLAYRRMLDLYYQKEAPLPNDVAKIAKMIRMREHIDAVSAVLDEFFVLDEADGDVVWRNHRADTELARIYDKSEKARASAMARHSKNKSSIKTADKTMINLDSCERTANAMLPNTQYPIQKEREISAQEIFVESPITTTETSAEPILTDGALSPTQVTAYLKAQHAPVGQHGFLASHVDLVKACAVGITPDLLTYAWEITCSKGKQNNAGYFFATLLGQAQDKQQSTLQVEKQPSRKSTTKADYTPASIATLVAAGVTEDSANEWAAFRASKNAGLITAEWLDRLNKEGKKLGLSMSLEDIVQWCLEKQQVRFEAAWLVKDRETVPAPQGAAYKPFENMPDLSAEEKKARHQAGKVRSAQLKASLPMLLAGGRA